ncbi:MAG TPA: hypothetical protein VGT08_09420 [Terracidiphilus sp.]|nr:hypothetical protein [Terracidiphilus sp.]
MTMTTLPGLQGTPQPTLMPSTFDNASKLLSVKSQKFVGAVTFGAGSIGATAPRTAASFMPEFEEELRDGNNGRETRLSVEQFAGKLGVFFLRQWNQSGMPNPAPPNQQMIFYVAGYDERAPYGRVFQLSIPAAPEPIEMFQGGNFGAIWGGQREITDRLLQGFDGRLPEMVQDMLGVEPANRKADLESQLKQRLGLPIPMQFLPLQDCVDLTIFLVRSTIQLQQWIVGLRGVGGAVDVATITRTDGFTGVQVKQIVGEREIGLR